MSGNRGKDEAGWIEKIGRLRNSERTDQDVENKRTRGGGGNKSEKTRDGGK